MTIAFLKDDLLFQLFPKIKKDGSNLKEVLIEYYSVDSEVPIIEIKDSLITIQLDTTKINQEQSKRNKVISFCEKGLFAEAFPLAKSMVEEYPKLQDFRTNLLGVR